MCLPRAINLKTEVGDEIEKILRAPGMVGRVTPRTPRLQPEFAGAPPFELQNAGNVAVSRQISGGYGK